jgi:hypothetical protein
MPDADENLYGPILKRIEEKLDRIEQENNTRFGNVELRLTMIETGQMNRKESANRVWAVLLMAGMPLVGVITWICTTITAHGYQIQQIDQFGSAYARKQGEVFETQLRELKEGKPKQ